MGKDIHIVPSGNGWNVKKAGQATPLSHHRTQSAAEDAGRPKAKANQSELVIHGKDGKIRDKDSYGKDSCPPKDRKH
jgi:hypothetical protein